MGRKGHGGGKDDGQFGPLAKLSLVRSIEAIANLKWGGGTVFVEKNGDYFRGVAVGFSR